MQNGQRPVWCKDCGGWDPKDLVGYGPVAQIRALPLHLSQIRDEPYIVSASSSSQEKWFPRYSYVINSFKVSG